MNIFQIVLMGLGGAVVIYWLASLIIGLTLNKKTLGEHWIKRNLKAAGIDPRDVPSELISRSVQGAYLGSIMSGPAYGRYEMHTFKNELKLTSRILIRHLSGASLNDDEKFLAGLTKNLPEPAALTLADLEREVLGDEVANGIDYPESTK